MQVAACLSNFFLRCGFLLKLSVIPESWFLSIFGFFLSGTSGFGLGGTSVACIYSTNLAFHVTSVTSLLEKC